jgi:hypothetical protein
VPLALSSVEFWLISYTKALLTRIWTLTTNIIGTGLTRRAIIFEVSDCSIQKLTEILYIK